MLATKKKNSLYETLPASGKSDEEHDGEYLTDRLASEAETLLQKFADDDTPFFLNFAFYNVHTPLMGKPELVKKFRTSFPKTRIASTPIRSMRPWSNQSTMRSVGSSQNSSKLELGMTPSLFSHPTTVASILPRPTMLPCARAKAASTKVELASPQSSVHPVSESRNPFPTSRSSRWISSQQSSTRSENQSRMRSPQSRMEYH